MVAGDCVEKMNAALEEFINSPDIKNIVLASMGPVYFDGTTFRGKDPARVQGQVVTLLGKKELNNSWKIYELAMRDTFARLSSLDDRGVVFVIDVPELGIDHGCYTGGKQLDVGRWQLSDLVGGIAANQCKIPRSEYDQRTLEYRRLVFEIASEFPSVRVFDPINLFCDEAWCYGFLPEVGYLYRDADHLSKSGSLYLAEQIVALLR